MVNQQIFHRLINNIHGYLNELRSAEDINYHKFMTDIRSQRFIERTLHIIIEACPEQVFAIYRNHLQDIDQFLALIQLWMNTEEKK